MLYKIIKTSSLKNDLNEKFKFLVEQNVPEKLIFDIFFSIRFKINSLEFYPQIYQKAYKNYHRVLVKSYSIFYKIDDNNKEVTIYRLLHQSQNFRKNLD